MIHVSDGSDAIAGGYDTRGLFATGSDDAEEEVELLVPALLDLHEENVEGSGTTCGIGSSGEGTT